MGSVGPAAPFLSESCVGRDFGVEKIGEENAFLSFSLLFFLSGTFSCYWF